MPSFKYGKYPKTRRFFEEDLSKLSKRKDKSNKKVFDAFVKYSGISEEFASQVLRSNYLPRVKVLPLPGRYGYTPDSSQIQLDKTFVKELEASLPNHDISRFSQSYAPTYLETYLLTLLEATVLHEMIHWCRLTFNEASRVNVSSRGKRGLAIEERVAQNFEIAAFGYEPTATNLSLEHYLPRTILNAGG